ncbi:MAG: hypothetical protein KAR47_08915 [Planctomycetes bacterium]|nr:hypothetical protein [Planctomycetota bacterium]
MKIFGVSRVRAVVSAVVVLLLVVQGVTYRFRAEATMPLAGIGHLAMYDVVRGGGFVVMDSVMWASLSEAQRDALLGGVGRYTDKVYYSLDEVGDSEVDFAPVSDEDRESFEEFKRLEWVSEELIEEKRREIESGRQAIALKNGVQVAWILQGRGLFWMKCSVSGWSSSEEGESRSDVYAWVLGWWVPVRHIFHATG